jgi:hypothetical protein
MVEKQAGDKHSSLFVLVVSDVEMKSQNFDSSSPSPPSTAWTSRRTLTASSTTGPPWATRCVTLVALKVSNLVDKIIDI